MSSVRVQSWWRVCAIGILALPWTIAAAAGVRAGDVPPDFVGWNRDGEKAFVSQYHGKVVVATFWASWCAPCRREMQVLENIQTKVSMNNLQVIAINFNEDRDTWRRIKGALKDVVLLLTHDRSGVVSKAYGVDSIPRVFLIDRSGRVAYTHTGYGEDALPGFVDEINELLRQPVAPPPESRAPSS